MEEVERFTSDGDDGRRYTVVLWASITVFRNSKGEVTRHRRGTVYERLDGTHVNFKEPGIFEIWDTEERIRKIVN